MDERKLIAVAVREDGTVSPHAGRALLWAVYDVWPGQPPVQAYAIQLNEQTCLHVWHTRAYPERHPLHAVDVAIAGSGGEGVQRRLAERQTLLLTTAEQDVDKAVVDYCAGTLAAGLPHDERECLGDGHAHAH
ncbi:NifB/NifX family molybdenum-iron cluster-binding protein [Insolitispirillum peregrinum]|uniref:Predicted Fe-Mo cluster-binding protein, NifX family n=1 Tax=Insolitispirillum peregrinum TaxID=80876 RepID=A0A1N7KDU9_9PROT|nr:NifB/NifX family molybdenum-iron cluster-binding protein [Insolitispirillum peregrinum]SIS59786.1 Predicted Fe-Mo cluster-binding protein, NifX family [Insolitispirillum peregrinum]